MDTSRSLETVKLNYKKLGSGQPLIILHGLFGSLDNWMTLAKQWSTEYEVWLVDQRNHGKSPHTNEHTYQHMAADLARFIKDHEIEQSIILGHSMGGKTAMEYALLEGSSVQKLVVVDIAPVSYKVHHWEIIEALASVKLESVSSRKDAETQLKKSIESFGIRQFLLKNLSRIADEHYEWKFNLPVLKQTIKLISEYPCQEGVYHESSLFVKGSESAYIKEAYQASIKQKFPVSKIVSIEGAGHWVHAEAPVEFKNTVDTFLKES